MKKFDRQSHQKPTEPYAGGQDPNRREPERKAPTAPEKDTGKTLVAAPWFKGKENLEGERSDGASSGHPLQLEDQKATSRPGRPDEQPGWSDRQRDAREDRGPSEEQPIER